MGFLGVMLDYQTRERARERERERFSTPFTVCMDKVFTGVFRVHALALATMSGSN